jgi:hypothetical protein
VVSTDRVDVCDFVGVCHSYCLLLKATKAQWGCTHKHR